MYCIPQNPEHGGYSASDIATIALTLPFQFWSPILSPSLTTITASNSPQHVRQPAEHLTHAPSTTPLLRSVNSSWAHTETSLAVMTVAMTLP